MRCRYVSVEHYAHCCHTCGPVPKCRRHVLQSEWHRSLRLGRGIYLSALLERHYKPALQCVLCTESSKSIWRLDQRRLYSRCLLTLRPVSKYLDGREWERDDQFLERLLYERRVGGWQVFECLHGCRGKFPYFFSPVLLELAGIVLTRPTATCRRRNSSDDALRQRRYSYKVVLWDEQHRLLLWQC